MTQEQARIGYQKTYEIESLKRLMRVSGSLLYISSDLEYIRENGFVREAIDEMQPIFNDYLHFLCLDRIETLEKELHEL